MAYFNGRSDNTDVIPLFQLMAKRTAKIRTYGKSSFSSDAELQQCVLSQMAKTEHRVKLAFITMFCLFVLSIAIAMLGFPAAILFCIPCSVVLTVFMIYNLIPRRKYNCNKCGDQIAIEWQSESGLDARFAVCSDCKTYIDTLWSSR